MIGLTNTFSRRKRFLPEYRDFFAALLNIPDEDVRLRVLDAVNGKVNCPICKSKLDYMDATTQTEGLENTNQPEILETTIDMSSKEVGVEKRRRKRKRNCPKVVKTAQHSDTIPVLKQDNVPRKAYIEQGHPSKISRNNSVDKAITAFFDDIEEPLSINLSISSEDVRSNESIEQQMKIEYLTSHIFNSSGLLPIHEAIVKNELPRLKRQIYVWKFRKTNLLDLVTEESGDNIIQLAIKENCFKVIINELLNEVEMVNKIDDDCNSIIHLAVIHLTYDDDQHQKHLLQLFERLLNKVDLNILLQQNNDGLTALHLAVKKNKYLMVEKILNVVDERLKLGSLPRPDEPCPDQRKFLKHYCTLCDSLEERREQHELKRKILNATDMKCGCTALYFAMDMNLEHIIYLLMAHMCNPTIKNLSGLDAKTYYADYGSNANITGNLEKLATIFQK